MKKIACIIILLTAVKIASATNYYISPSGNDSNTGTITSPFFTLNKAWSVVQPGDIVYARGGVYRYSSRQNLHYKNGTASDTIRLWSYPGERPVFTKSSSFTTPSFPISLIYLKGSYIHIRGIEVAGFTQETSGVWYGIAATGSNNNKFERINSHHNGNGMGIRDNCNNNLILNCDFHHNFDPITDYGNADGLSVAYHTSSLQNTVRGCRFWLNSDDGLDLWENNGSVTVEGCWSWKNGYRFDGVTTAGDGCGFKFGTTTTEDGTTFKRTVRNNISFENRTRGYMQNSAMVRFYFYNNIAWNNSQGIVFSTFNLAHIFRNNIVFENNENWNGNYSNSVRDHNSNSPTPIATSADFASTDTTGVSGPRQANGNLPVLTFMKLVSGSDLIDAGINVGLSYTGSAPDIGSYEFRSSVIPPATVNLAYQSSLVKSSNASEVEITYNVTLAPVVPSLSCFEVKVNSTVRNITNLIISGNKVYLTLSSPVNPGETVTLSYTKPATNPLQCTAGTFAETIT
ncbi:MAG TPA: SwmB domain-containing protein, partial [Bacteroidales bacterium]|nr:SwmB domain-containing protein [Bacteroidales bacterium]